MTLPKNGQVRIAGRITNKRETMVKDKQYYHVELTTESQYPYVYDFWTEDPQHYGADDPAKAVGQMVVVLAYVNGRKQTDYLKDGVRVALKYPRYSVSLRISEIEPAKVGEDGVRAVPKDEVSDDMPF